MVFENRQRSSIVGKMIPAKIPNFIFPLAALETMPTKVGPLEHPISPANASKANIAVPPVGSETDALLKGPGHIMPTDRPQMAHPIKLRTGCGERLTSR